MADLIERLRAVESGEECTNWYRNPDGPEAASRIAELEAEVARLRGALLNARVAFGLDGWHSQVDAIDAALAAPDTGGADG